MNYHVSNTNNPIDFPKSKNSRIQELMPKPWTFPYPDRELYTKEQLEKFAELIVKECIKEMGRYEFIDVAMREVKEHFGVE